MDWNSLRYVLVLARLHSLQRASEELGVDPSTVSRRVRALEAEIGARFFERTPAGHDLTAVGRRWLQTAEQVEQGIEATEKETTQADLRPEGRVTVSAPDHLVRHRLAGLAARFRQAYAQVDFDFRSDNEAGGGDQRESDLAICEDRPESMALASRRLASVGLGLFAAPCYLAATPMDSSCSLSGHRVLARNRDVQPGADGRWLEKWGAGGQIVLRTGSYDALLAAAVAGLGVAVLPCFLADSDSRLVRLLGPESVALDELWLVVRRDARRVARVRAFADFILSEFGRDGELAGAGIAAPPGAAGLVDRPAPPSPRVACLPPRRSAPRNRRSSSGSKVVVAARG